MSKKTWIIFIVICVAILGGLVFLSRQDQVNVTNVDQGKLVAASSSNGNIADHTLGNRDSKNVLIEYGDFECPGCQSAHPKIKEVVEAYNDKLVFIFRNNPLTSIHPNARAGAAAAEAAGLQGKYWEMHDLLYDKQAEWSKSSVDKRVDILVGYARQIGVKDIEKFKSDMESKPVSDKINFDLALGKKVPVSGTPTILINGKLIENTTWNDIDKFKKAVEDELK